MQLLVVDPSYADWEGDPAEIPEEIRTALRDLGPIELDRADIGPGADWPMFLTIISGIGTVFLLGERINKSLEAWVAIGRKLRSGLDVLRKRLGAVRVDEVGAHLLLLEHLASKRGIPKSAELISSQTIAIHEFPGRPVGELGSRYDALYSVVLRVDGDHLVVAGIRSSGEVDFVRTYGSHFMTFGAPAT